MPLNSESSEINKSGRNSRINYAVSLADAKASLEVAETLAPVVAPKKPFIARHTIDDLTNVEDGIKYPIYPSAALASNRLREEIKRERRYVACMAAIALGVCTIVGYSDGTFSNVRNYFNNKIEDIGSFLDRPNQEILSEFRQKANRFHSQR